MFITLTSYHQAIFTLFLSCMHEYVGSFSLSVIENRVAYFLFQDNFGRLHDRSKETPKVIKQLNRLFPNKVTIQIPQVSNITLLALFGSLIF